MDFMGLTDQHENRDLHHKYLTFLIDKQHYGLSITNVIEIVQVQVATQLPELPYYAKGIINLRGRVVPLIDINLRFNKPEQEYTDRTCIIIVDIDGVHVGFIVDQVEEVLDIEEDRISPPPSFTADPSTRFVIGIGRMDHHLVLLLNSRLLVSDSDLNLMGQMA